MKNYYDIDYRTSDVSKEFAAYDNCNVMYMDYSYTKLMYKTVSYAIIEAERQLAATKNLLILAKEAKVTILENEAKWKEEAALVGSVSDKLSLNPNVQRISISIINLEDGSVPPLLDSLINEYEHSLIVKAHELIAMMSIKEELADLLNSSPLDEDGEEIHSQTMRKKYYALDNYQDEMKAAIESESEEDMKKEIQKLVERVYATYKDEFKGLEETGYKSLPQRLNTILSAIKRKQLKGN